jgi:CopG family nickel-responsive transcriptional regulator
MSIISVSLNEEIIEEMNRLQKELGLSGKSELVRAGIRMLSTDIIGKEKMKGIVSCILTVTHEEKDEETVTTIKHKFENIVRTHVHCKLKGEKCLELFLIEGDAEKVTSMTKMFQREEDMSNVRLVIT